jgi:cell division protein FtsB
LQQYDAWLRVRVKSQEELSKRTQDAYRLTRKLGGYVAWANYSTPANRGDSEVQVQIPIRHVQAAIAAFSAYGTLIGQRIRLKDLQQRVDTLSARIQRLRARIARLHDPRDRARLAQLLRARSSTVRQGQMASVALAMVVGKTAAAAPPGRFHRTVDDAGSVLVRELEILVYALVVAGPLLLLGLMGLAAARGARRRSDRRLLERA